MDPQVWNGVGSDGINHLLNHYSLLSGCGGSATIDGASNSTVPPAAPRTPWVQELWETVDLEGKPWIFSILKSSESVQYSILYNNEMEKRCPGTIESNVLGGREFRKILAIVL
jgi:hypothetical protein